MRDPNPRNGLFQGSELTRLLLLVAVALVGAALIYGGYQRQVAQEARERANPPADRPVVGGAPLPPPASGPEFEGIRDKTELSSRDNPAYKTLLDWSRANSDEALARQARRDVLFSQIIETPERYRGIPIHLQGNALRIIRQDVEQSKLFPDGEFFEVYAATQDSRPNFYMLVSDDAPEGLPIGDNLDEPITFDGYFFKLHAYHAGDKARFVPMLVGRLHRQGARTGQPTAPLAFGRAPWLGWALGALVLYLVIRWGFTLRKILGRPVPRPPSTAAVRDEIDPAELSEWLESQEADDSDEEPWR